MRIVLFYNYVAHFMLGRILVGGQWRPHAGFALSGGSNHV